jgi:CHAD domain-containing protein
LRSVLRHFVLSRDVGSEADAAFGLTGSAFALSDGTRSVTLRRLWLDTFDWRLYRSGLTLEQVSSRGETQMVLTGRDGTVIAAEQLGRRRSDVSPADGEQVAGGHESPGKHDAPDLHKAPGPGGRPRDDGRAMAGRPQDGRVTWPARLDVLPLGPLRDHLVPVVGVRALLPVARAVSTVRDMRVLNANEKTIARLTVDRMSVTYPAAGDVAPRLTVTALRGYQTQALRMIDLLAAAPGIADGGSQSALEAALAAAGRRPGEYSSKIDVKLTPRMPAAVAMAAVLSALFDALEANVNGTVRDLDTEFLHDLRLAVRRTRSALKLAGDVLPGDLASRFRAEFKWLGDMTTPTRDLDVYLLGYSAMADGLIAGTADELRPFHDHLLRSRATAQRDLVRGLRSARFARLAREWREALTATASSRARPTIARLAAARITRAQRRVIRDGCAISAASPPESLHELRKRCKELRYLLEFFASLYDPAQHWQAVRELKALQNCLGEFQDTQVQQAEIRAFAAQMMKERAAPAATLLAMGEIAAGLAVRQRQARIEFAGRFGDFASPASQDRIQALTRAAA